MNLPKPRYGLRMISLSATSVLCVLLASVITQHGSTSGSLKKKPLVVLQASTTKITRPCSPDAISNSGSCPSTVDFQVALTTIAKDFDKQPLYVYTVTGGRVVGEGGKVTWDFSEVGPGWYQATVEVQDRKKHRALASVTVTISNCGDCVFVEPCPTISVDCYDKVMAGTPITCKLRMYGLTPLITYEWSARDSSGEDLTGTINGRGKLISIPTNGLGGKSVDTRVDFKGLDPSCARTASSSTIVKP